MGCRGVNSSSHQQNPPRWPQVMEAAYTKFRTEQLGAVPLKTESQDTRLGDIKTFLSNDDVRSPAQVMQGELNDIGQGDDPANALYALTGQRSTMVQASELSNQNHAWQLLGQAQQQGRPMILSTNALPNMPHDGLVKGTWDADPAKRSGHAYMVQEVSQAANGDVMLTLVNPWGNNSSATQLDTKDFKDSSSPVVQVKLKDIVANGHLECIEIGPVSAPPPAQH
jgi:hypothetical protein